MKSNSVKSLIVLLLQLFQRELSEKQCNQIVGSLLHDLIAGIKTPERARSPIGAYDTEEDVFKQNNPEVRSIGLYYSVLFYLLITGPNILVLCVVACLEIFTQNGLIFIEAVSFEIHAGQNQPMQKLTFLPRT
jgi:hypothetical protein